jgi:hypothetical protein
MGENGTRKSRSIRQLFSIFSTVFVFSNVTQEQLDGTRDRNPFESHSDQNLGWFPIFRLDISISRFQNEDGAELPLIRAAGLGVEVS